MVLVFLSACDPFKDAATWSDAGGYEEVVLDLPFADGYQTLCTQGVNGAYSHTGTSTENDIDFDTPNGSNDLVYAPVGGVAYVHMESASRNFGYHVNIDRGDGSYVVLAHLSDIFVSDGSEVAAGELLGYEGCTGNCSGDHVHIGLHEGDASQMAEFGRSEPVSYELDDVTAGEEGETIASDEVVCGTTAGHIYRSRLPVGTWHPDGSLVKTPDANDVYLIKDGQRRWIESEEVFWEMGFDFRNVALISPAELDCYDVGETIDAPEVLPTSYASADGSTVLIEGDLVKEASRSDVYVISDGVAMPIVSYDVLLQLGWGERPITQVDDGMVADLVGAVGSCSADFWCLSEDTLGTCMTEGSEELGEGGSEDSGETEEPETNEDPSSMLEGEIEDGEFGLAFVPPSSFEAEFASLIASAVTDDGETLFAGRVLAANYEGGEILYTTNDLPPGTTFDFGIEYSDGMSVRYACEEGLRLTGELFAVYGSQSLSIEPVNIALNENECTLRVHIPELSEIETGEDTGTTSGETGTDEDHEVEICYAPGGTMVAGELYLDGGFFTYWDSDPADSASSGDAQMCATVEVVTGEEIKMNAWFMESSTVEWAAYNDWCLSIDWQGTLTVDGGAVSVETRPWSAAAWASDPCLTGGDAFFHVP